MNKICFVCVISLLFLVNCKNKSNVNSAEETESEIIMEEEETPFPDIEEGVVFLKNVDPFGGLIELNGMQFIPEDDSIFWPGHRALINNDVMIVKGGKPGPFALFNYPSLTFIKKIGVPGQGPTDYIIPDIIKTDDPELICYLYEGTRDDLYKLTRDLEVIPVDYKLNPYAKKGLNNVEKDIYNIGSDDFIFVNQSSTGKSIFRTRLINDSIQTEEIFSLQLHPKYKSQFNYIGDLGVNAKKNRMVYAYKYYKILKFMDLDGKTVRTLNYLQDEFDEGTLKMVNGLDQNVTHYWGIYAGDEYVYCVHSGRTPMEVHREMQKDGGSIYVEQYDWNGNPVRRYKLDKWGKVYADEKANKLVLLAFEDDPFRIYDLP